MAEQQEYTVGQCSSCTAPVIWGRTALGRSMPVDAEPSQDGTVALEPRAGAPGQPAGTPAPLARVVPAKLAFGRKDLRRPHWQSCPYADSHRKRGGRR